MDGEREVDSQGARVVLPEVPGPACGPLVKCIAAATQVLLEARTVDQAAVASWRMRATQTIMECSHRSAMRRMLHEVFDRSPERALAEFDDTWRNSHPIRPQECLEVREAFHDVDRGALRDADRNAEGALLLYGFVAWRWLPRAPVPLPSSGARSEPRSQLLAILLNRLAAAVTSGDIEVTYHRYGFPTGLSGSAAVLWECLEDKGNAQGPTFERLDSMLRQSTFHGTNALALQGMRERGMLSMSRVPSHEEIAEHLTAAGLIREVDGRAETDVYAASSLKPGHIEWTHPFQAWEYATISPEWFESIELRGSRKFKAGQDFASLRATLRGNAEVVVIGARHVCAAAPGWERHPQRIGPALHTVPIDPAFVLLPRVNRQ